jgi:hypothetical protein
MTKNPRDNVVFLSNNEVRFLSLSRVVKVKPSYLPRAAERYHSQEAAAFAAEHYQATGQVLLPDEVEARPSHVETGV